jgi:hypothetical protein
VNTTTDLIDGPLTADQADAAYPEDVRRRPEMQDIIGVTNEHLAALLAAETGSSSHL